MQNFHGDKKKQKTKDVKTCAKSVSFVEITVSETLLDGDDNDTDSPQFYIECSVCNHEQDDLTNGVDYEKELKELMTSHVNTVEEKDATIERLHEQISVLQQQINQFQDIEAKIEDELQNEGLSELLDVSLSEQVLFLLKERNLILEDLDKAQEHISELEEQKVISDNLIEELELDKTELAEEFSLYKLKSREEWEAKETESDTQLNVIKSQLEQMRDRNVELESLLDDTQAANGDAALTTWENDKLKNELRDTKERFSDSKNRETRLEEELELTRDKLKTTRRDAEQNNQMIADLEIQLSEQKDAIDDLQDQMEERDLKLDTLMQENAALLELSSHTIQSPVSSKSNTELQKALEELNLKTQQYNELQEDFENNEAIITTQKKHISELSTKLAEHKSEFNFKLQKMVTETETKSRTEIAKLSTQLTEILSINESLKTEMTSLKTEVTTFKTSTDANSSAVMESNLKLAREELAKNREYIHQLELQLEEAKRLCLRQGKLHEEAQERLQANITALKRKLSDHFLSTPATPTPADQAQQLTMKFEEKLEFLSNERSSMKLDILKSASKVIVCQAKTLNFATVFECGKHVPY